MTQSALYQFLGRSLVRQTRRMQRNSGTYQTAKTLRSRGIGLGVALALLTGRII